MIALKSNCILIYSPNCQVFYVVSANSYIYTKSYLMLTENVEGSLLTISELEKEFLYENAINLERRWKKPNDSPFGLLEPGDVQNRQESQLVNKGDGPLIWLETLYTIFRSATSACFY